MRVRGLCKSFARVAGCKAFAGPVQGRSQVAVMFCRKEVYAATHCVLVGRCGGAP